MSTIVIELYDALRKAGVDEGAAKAAAQAVMSEHRPDLATKTDIADLRTATKTDIADLRAATKADIAELRVAIADARTDTIRWSVGTLLAMTGVFAGIVKLLG